MWSGTSEPWRCSDPRKLVWLTDSLDTPNSKLGRRCRQAGKVPNASRVPGQGEADSASLTARMVSETRCFMAGREAKARPEPWREWRGVNPALWKWPFLLFEWLCEWGVYWLRRWAFVEFLELVGRLAILWSIVSFALTYRVTQEAQFKAKHYQAWQLINSGHGQSGSGGRIDALQDLAKDKVSLAAVDLSGATLTRINLPRADLREADLEGTNLKGANLDGTDLRGARNLECDQLKFAANWQGAFRNEQLACGGLVPFGEPVVDLRFPSQVSVQPSRTG